MASHAELKDNRFPEIITELPIKVERNEKRIADKIARDARSRVDTGPWVNYPSTHREPGWLAGSIKSELGDGGANVNVGAFYGRFVEFGTDDMIAEPYLVPAAEAAQPELIADVVKTLKRL